MHTKHLPLLFVCSFFTFTFSVNAQTKEERNKIITSVNKTALISFQKILENRHVESEKKVDDFLKKHPLLERSFVKAGSVYYLQRIDADGNPVYINTKNKDSGILIKADQMYTGGSIGVNITGQNMVAGIWDGGQVRTTHELLSGKVAMQENQALDGTTSNYSGNNHQTHVSGTMVGKDITNQPSARGIAFGATALNYDFANDKSEMTAFASSGFLISNHSYGYGNGEGDPLWRFGAYDNESLAWDVITKNAPNYLPFVAVGNEQNPTALDGNNKRINGNWTKGGYDIITGASASKNVMTVGAVNGDKTMSDYSNWGPTDDGRVKPDIVAKGTGINSSLFANGTTNLPSDNSYSGNGVSSSGTSYATPAVSAAALLLQQYYKSLNGNYMKAATLKALMLGTAEDLGQPGPDNKFGWGLLNVEKAANAIKYKSATGSPIAQSQTDLTTKGAYIEEITYNVPTNNTELTRVVYASGCEPLIVSIAWTDDEGIEQLSTDGIDPTTSRLVHNFDFLVRNLSNAVDVRTWKPSIMANRTADATLETDWFDGNGNNYKQVKIANPIAGQQYSINVRKSSTSPTAAKSFSLVVTGTQVANPTALAQNFCGSKTVADLVTTSGTNIKWYDALTMGNLLTASTALTTRLYYASQTVNGCESARTSVNVTVNTFTTPSVNISPVTVCAGTTQTITTTSTNGGTPTFLWKRNNVDLATTQNITVTNAVANDVYAVTMTPSADTCPNPTTPTATTSVTIGAGCTLTINSIISGNWETVTTWDLNRLPTTADTVIINANHIVTVTSNDANAKRVETRSSGKVIFNDNAAKIKLGF